MRRAAVVLAAAALAATAAPEAHAAGGTGLFAGVPVAGAPVGAHAARADRRRAARRRARARARRVATGRLGARGRTPAGWGAWLTTPAAALADPAAPGAVTTPVTGGSATPQAPVTPAGPGTGGDTGADLPDADPRSVAVVSREWSFTLSQQVVRAGTVRVQFDNSRAEDPHELGVHGSALGVGRTAAHSRVSTSWDLTPGTYVLYCPIPGHEAAGMQATLTVVP